MLKHFVAIAIAVAVAAGCSSGSSNVQTVESPEPVGPTATTTTVEPSPTAQADTAANAANQYVVFFAKGDPASIAKMIPLTEPGSVAHAYAIHQRAVAQAQRAGGAADLGQGPAIPADTGYKLCDPDATSNCTVYDDFKALQNGKLVSFTVNGQPIEKRLISSKERDPQVLAAVSVQLISAYRTITTDNLLVTFEVKNGTKGEITVASYDSQYVDAAGQQAKAAENAGLTDLQSGAATVLLSSFPGVDVGGTITLEVFDGDFDTIATFKIPVQ